MTSNPYADPVPRARWRPRFTITTLLLILLVCSVTAAAGRYYLESRSGDTSARAVFVITTLVLPMLLMVVANIARWAILASRRSRS